MVARKRISSPAALKAFSRSLVGPLHDQPLSLREPVITERRQPKVYPTASLYCTSERDSILLLCSIVHTLSKLSNRSYSPEEITCAKTSSASAILFWYRYTLPK